MPGNHLRRRASVVLRSVRAISMLRRCPLSLVGAILAQLGATTRHRSCHRTEGTFFGGKDKTAEVNRREQVMKGQLNDRGLFIDEVAGGRHRLIEVIGEGGPGQVRNDQGDATTLKLGNAKTSVHKVTSRWQVFTWTGRFATRWPLLVIGVWLALPCALFFAFPPLSHAIKEHPVSLVPASAPAMVTERQMTEAFHESGGDNLLLAVLTDDGGLSPADEDVYRALVAGLHGDA